MDYSASQHMICASQEGYVSSHACTGTCVIFRMPVESEGRIRMWEVL